MKHEYALRFYNDKTKKSCLSYTRFTSRANAEKSANAWNKATVKCDAPVIVTVVQMK